MYALRADVLGESFQADIVQWIRQFDSYMLVFETAKDENPHVHAVIHTQLKIKQLRNSFTYKFKEHTGNKAYSLKQCDDEFDAYIRYICKGTSKDDEPVVWAKCGLLYDDETIREAHGMYWVNNAALVKNRGAATRVEKMKPVELVEKECKELGLKGFDREGIAKVYIRLWRDARKPINVYAARAVINTVSQLLDGGSDDDLARKIAEL